MNFTRSETIVNFSALYGFHDVHAQMVVFPEHAQDVLLPYAHDYWMRWSEHKDRTRIVLTIDKGVALVVMDRKEYLEKATNLLSQSTYRTIAKDPTNRLKAKLITLLRQLQGTQDWRNTSTST